ncbi:MAG TPA: Hsp20 family protein [Aestuariivirga sp.]|nr:Hsp20 family protein [Aestuariivirga sp.]
MSKISMFSSPLLLGFDDLERLLDRAVKTSGEGYPPYNIERLTEGGSEVLRITIAVAGFRRQDLEITIEDNQLNIRGRIKDDGPRDYLHRGIAGRQFDRAFVLADGMDVIDATLVNGLLIINLRRPEPSSVIRRIEIKE